MLKVVDLLREVDKGERIEGKYVPNKSTFYHYQDGSEDSIEAQKRMKFLEPEAGDGRIALFLKKLFPYATIHVIEKDALNRKILESQGLTIIGEDFMETEITEKYNYILMNPPFATLGNTKAYIDHILKAYDCLSLSGRLCAIASGSMTIDSSRKTKDFRNFVAERGWWEQLPDNTFEESGTKTKTVILYLEPMQSEDIARLLSQECEGFPSGYAHSLGLTLESDESFIDSLHRLAGFPKEQALPQIANLLDMKSQEKLSREGFCFSYSDTVRQQLISYFYDSLVTYTEENKSFANYTPPEKNFMSEFWECKCDGDYRYQHLTDLVCRVCDEQKPKS